MIIDLIAGARPNFMKVAAIIRAFERQISSGGTLCYRLIHTGQHYDPILSGTFFDQLNIPQPEINLGVGSGSQAEQTAAIMIRYEALLLKSPSSLCLVVGDVTSTMACAIAAQKLCIPVAHVEGGIRSGDWTMPEEINRVVTDAISNWFFTTSEVANNNLRKSGVSSDRIFFVGNTMIDTLLSNIDRLQKPDFFDKFNLRSQKYFVVTLHRPSNVDHPGNLSKIINSIGDAARDFPIIFPMHPRTAKKMQEIDLIPGNLIIVDPQPYLEFNYLVKYSKSVITDSGGITEEATVMGVPCLTLRNTTERPETVTIGTNELIGTDPSFIKPALDKVFADKWKSGSIPDKWDGMASDRILSCLGPLLKSVNN